MKKKPQPPPPPIPSHEVEDGHDLEILKAAAQAWHGRSGQSKAANEFDAGQKSRKAKAPTRFWLESITKKPMANGSFSKWDFNESLWDSYEIVAVSRRLEAGMVLDHPFEGPGHGKNPTRRPGESKNSLRSLFNVVSSRRFTEPDHDRHSDRSKF